MGDRYILTVTCPQCGRVDDDVYFAPTCGFTEHTCACGQVVDLTELTGLTFEDASNRGVIQAMCGRVREKVATGESIDPDELLRELDGELDD